MSIAKRIWARWKTIAHKIGNFQARLILILFYFIILAPFALIVRQIDPLRIRKNSSPGWQERTVDSTALLEKSVRQW